jgi:hypothetical protein
MRNTCNRNKLDGEIVLIKKSNCYRKNFCFRRKSPDYQYPAYFKAKLLLALVIKTICWSFALPAKKKNVMILVWEIAGSIFK